MDYRQVDDFEDFFDGIKKSYLLHEDTPIYRYEHEGNVGFFFPTKTRLADALDGYFTSHANAKMAATPDKITKFENDSFVAIKAVRVTVFDGYFVDLHSNDDYIVIPVREIDPEYETLERVTIDTYGAETLNKTFDFNMECFMPFAP